MTDQEARTAWMAVTGRDEDPPEVPTLGRSSAVERQALNLDVEGSSPSAPTDDFDLSDCDCPPCAHCGGCHDCAR